MSAISYISNSLKQWNAMVHGDYKVFKVVFIVPSTAFVKLPDIIIKSWEQENLVYGIVEFPIRMRISKIMNLMPDAKLFKCNKINCRELCKISNIDVERDVDDFLKSIYENFLHHLSNTD
jgi:hypothetical protein